MHKIYLLAPITEDPLPFPHNNLEYIKYYLIDHGYEPKVIDCNHYKDHLNDVISILKEDEKPIVGVTAYSRERFYAYDLIRMIKKEIPDSAMVVGGRHFGSLADETLRELPEVDIVVRGEGEITVKEICDAVCNDSGYENILGVSYKDGDKIVHNEERLLEKELDKFRCFDKNYLSDYKEYRLSSSTKLDKENKYITVFASRGCPNKCVFCGMRTDTIRFRSVDSILQEIDDKMKITGANAVAFMDPSLTNRRKFVEELCGKIIERRLNFRWNCYSRVNIDTELLKLMKKAGLISVEIGLESGSPKVLKSIKKNISLEQFEKFCKEAYALKIKIFVFCMISLPDETPEDFDMTLNLLKRLSKYIYHVGIQPTRIQPDAALVNIAKERGIIPKDFNWFKPYQFEHIDKMSTYPFRHLPHYLEHFTPQEISDKLREYEKSNIGDFFFFYNYKESIFYNLRYDVIRNLTLKDIARKAQKAIKLFMASVNNLNKAKYYK